MKLFLTTLLTFSMMSVLHAQKSDYASIEKTIWYYLDGDTQKDYEILKKAFHENATMKYISSKTGYTEYNALEAFKSIKGKSPETNRVNSIVYINVAGNAATAKVEVVYPKAVIVDYLTLLRVDGNWKIVGKIFSKKNITKNP